MGLSPSGLRERRRPPRPAPGAAAWRRLLTGLLLALPAAGIARAVRADTQLVATAEPAVRSLVEAGAGACRQALARRFGTSTAQVDAWLVPAQLIAIEGGERSLAALRQEGLAYGWMVRGKPDPLPIGLCRTDGRPAVVAIEEQKD